MIETLQDVYSCPVGYSGHERGLLPSILAVSLGAVALERHITLDRTMYGSDQSASLEPEGLRRLVRDTRHVRATLGTGEKTYSSEERQVSEKLRYLKVSEKEARFLPRKTKLDMTHVNKGWGWEGGFAMVQNIVENFVFNEGKRCSWHVHRLKTKFSIFNLER